MWSRSLVWNSDGQIAYFFMLLLLPSLTTWSQTVAGLQQTIIWLIAPTYYNDMFLLSYILIKPFICKLAVLLLRIAWHYYVKVVFAFIFKRLYYKMAYVHKDSIVWVKLSNFTSKEMFISYPLFPGQTELCLLNCQVIYWSNLWNVAHFLEHCNDRDACSSHTNSSWLSYLSYQLSFQRCHYCLQFSCIAASSDFWIWTFIQLV